NLTLPLPSNRSRRLCLPPSETTFNGIRNYDETLLAIYEYNVCNLIEGIDSDDPFPLGPTQVRRTRCSGSVYFPLIVYSQLLVTMLSAKVTPYIDKTRRRTNSDDHLFQHLCFPSPAKKLTRSSQLTAHAPGSLCMHISRLGKNYPARVNKQSGQIVNWLNEDEDVIEHESVDEADHLSESEHNSDTEQEATMSDEDYEDDAPLSQFVSYKVCPKKKDRKTTTSCHSCTKMICKEHSVPFCEGVSTEQATIRFAGGGGPTKKIIRMLLMPYKESCCRPRKFEHRINNIESEEDLLLNSVLRVCIYLQVMLSISQALALWSYYMYHKCEVKSVKVKLGSTSKTFAPFFGMPGLWKYVIRNLDCAVCIVSDNALMRMSFDQILCRYNR
ncbi:hypothetical protein L9F63_008912, partial [Diploptera punctata]